MLTINFNNFWGHSSICVHLVVDYEVKSFTELVPNSKMLQNKVEICFLVPGAKLPIENRSAMRLFAIIGLQGQIGATRFVPKSVRLNLPEHFQGIVLPTYKGPRKLQCSLTS